MRCAKSLTGAVSAGSDCAAAGRAAAATSSATSAGTIAMVLRRIIGRASRR